MSEDTALKPNLPTFTLEGYPEGSIVRGLSLDVPASAELARLGIFRRELAIVQEWTREAMDLQLRASAQEAIAAAALVKFCGCFSSSREGLRRKPLSEKLIYSPHDRLLISDMKHIRNKLVAHDEQLYPGTFPLMVFDAEANAIGATLVDLRFGFRNMKQFDELPRLSQSAFDWVVNAIREVGLQIVEGANLMPVEDRREICQGPPLFEINVRPSDKRF